jgi:hypothetical protein
MEARWKPNRNLVYAGSQWNTFTTKERIDFRQHLREMFSTRPWLRDGLREEYVRVESCRQALDAFLAEREASIAWLKALGSPDWDAASRAQFGPAEEVLVLRAGDLLVSWVAHDYLHIRQMNELLFAWNEKEASPYSVVYAGGW